MSETDFSPQDFVAVTLVDRSGLGGFEFMFGGRPYVFKKGVPELPTVQSVAVHALKSTHNWGWTEDDQYTCRLAVKEPNDDLLAIFGETCGDCSEIKLSERWPLRKDGWEGWDAPYRRPEEYRGRSIRPDVDPARVHQASLYGPARIT